jgi:hypothetical protein
MLFRRDSAKAGLRPASGMRFCQTIYTRGNKWPDSFAIINNNNNKIFCANDYSYHARGYWCFTDEDADTRPSGTCVDAGPDQFTDEHWNREQAMKARRAQDDATVLLISHGWDREDAQAFVAAIAKMIEGRS